MAAFVFLRICICVFGIVGNTLVIALILKRKILFIKKNYYILVLHLAICDAMALLSIFFIQMKSIPISLNCSYIAGIHTVF